MNESAKTSFDVNQIDWNKVDGLVPAIVQDSASGSVLMLGYMNRDAVEKTMNSGEVTFFSRSRNQLWTKGETSGNKLRLVSIDIDCDRDTLLILAGPTGPVCHRNTPTCFGEMSTPQIGFLTDLQKIIESRRGANPESSYTARLLSKPLHQTAQKVGEEAVETVLAATSRDDNAVIDEAADLVYHLMVLLAAKDLDFSAVVSRLRQRHLKS